MFNKDNEYEWFTFAFAPMRNKLSSSYEYIYKTIKAWIRLECDMDKPKIRVDFEKALINANSARKVSG
ncbi:hypothetical protein L596_010992 [Steinernema carpocapsae]|uniref:Uncharacterized protein n=1 Tax=Steinernema carpocapsae TaxID=34508 RepID=A0A4U5NTF3_STECR|nr:hypothetical protein L596_010992 [Steinernema carpocapsae]